MFQLVRKIMKANIGNNKLMEENQYQLHIKNKSQKEKVSVLIYAKIVELLEKLY